VKKFDVVQLLFHSLHSDPSDEEADHAGSQTEAVQTLPQISPKTLQHYFEPQREKGLAFAPTNIALCKYWGKRDTELNLPMTSSLSVALPNKGAMTTLVAHDKPTDVIVLNGKELGPDTEFSKRVVDYLDLFRPEKKWHLQIDIDMTIPVAAGLASSACGFASLISAMNDLFAWELSARTLSILARLGSGSACRSMWNGFVEWHAGTQSDGMDSYAEPLTHEWSDLCVGILSVSDQPKPISSRDAMQHTVDTSILYNSWPRKVTRDMVILRQAMQSKNFSLLGGVAESNALTMHATMLSSWPPVCYSLPETIAAMHKIWDLRNNGLELYFTQDAGPNLKLLFVEKNRDHVVEAFPQVEVIKLFED
jgi:diphosphomevalonate decarboxylase